MSQSYINYNSILQRFKNKLVVLSPLIRKKYYEKNLKLKIDKIFTFLREIKNVNNLSIYNIPTLKLVL
mgnify:CR=1 FL=1